MNEMITYEAPLLRGCFITFNQRPHFDFLKVKQTHSDIVLPEDKCGDGETNADGIVGVNKMPKVILTADCLPIVLLGKTEHAVVHAGWKGLEGNILTQENVKKIAPTYAFIGPHIRSENYEVQKDFLPNFKDYPEAFKTVAGKIFFNLSHVAINQLRKNYPNIVIEDCELCTFQNPKFHSYRRNQTTNRNWNVYFPE